MNHRGMSGQLRSEPQTRAVGRMKKLKLNFFAEKTAASLRLLYISGPKMKLWMSLVLKDL